MKKLLICDLKNKLIDEKGAWVPGAKGAIFAARSAGVPVMLYSMNEPWTYDILNQNTQTFCNFAHILLVSKKRVEDLAGYAQSYSPLVIGDSLTEELLFGRQLGYRTIQVNGRVTLSEVRDYLAQGGQS